MKRSAAKRETAIIQAARRRLRPMAITDLATVFGVRADFSVRRRIAAVAAFGHYGNWGNPQFDGVIADFYTRH